MKKIVDSKTIKRNLVYALTIGVSIFFLFFFVGSVWIGHEVKSLCQNAKWQYLPAGRQADGDCVEALIAQLNDEHQGKRARNHAIWALGQLGDDRALSVLQSYCTGNIPDREPLDEGISQYELKKAITLASGGFNITSFVWRP